METITKIGIGVMGAATTIFGLIFNSQNKKIDAIDEKKTNKDLCKTLHKSLDTTTTEIKDDVSDVKKNQILLMLDFAGFKKTLEGIEKALEKQGG